MRGLSQHRAKSRKSWRFRFGVAGHFITYFMIRDFEKLSQR